MKQTLVINNTYENKDRFLINNKKNSKFLEDNIFSDILNEINYNNNGTFKFNKLNYKNFKSPKFPILENYEPMITLDTPNLSNNFYYNVIDWSNENEISIALHNEIFLFNPLSFTSHEIYSYNEDNPITCIKFNNQSTLLASSNENCELDIFDYKFQKKIRSYNTNNRCCTLEFTNNIIFEGNKNGEIIIRDIRMSDPYISKYNNHYQEIVKLKLNSEKWYLASGGNDNYLNILDLRKLNFIFEVEAHKAAIKGWSWDKTKSGVIASGGGYGDNKIKIWNINNSKLINEIDTHNQVCNIDILPNNEIISTHGYSDNLIQIRDFDSLDLKASFNSHNDRVIYYSSKYDKNTNKVNFITGACEEIKIWDWNCKTKKEKDDKFLNAINFLR